MNRLIITGANGSGKSHFAKRLAAARPDLQLIHFDALKLTTGWRQRPQAEIVPALLEVIDQPNWILEGGPSLLQHAAPNADTLVWLDPPEHLRAYRLFLRPLKSIGQTRSEIPEGNVDWPWQQYRFAWRSLRNIAGFRARIECTLSAYPNMRTWRCRKEVDLDAAMDACRKL